MLSSENWTNPTRDSTQSRGPVFSVHYRHYLRLSDKATGMWLRTHPELESLMNSGPNVAYPKVKRMATENSTVIELRIATTANPPPRTEMVFPTERIAYVVKQYARGGCVGGFRG
jgi:hypothetical protein